MVYLNVKNWKNGCDKTRKDKGANRNGSQCYIMRTAVSGDGKEQETG